MTTTIESRSKKIADNVTKNNGLYSRLSQRGNIKTISGGSIIYEELSFAENGNGGWYSGYDLLPVAAQDVISAAQFNIKQFAVPVVISGLEQLQNSGKEAMIDLMEARMAVAEATMANALQGGLRRRHRHRRQDAGRPRRSPCPSATASQTNTYGGIDRTVVGVLEGLLHDRAGPSPSRPRRSAAATWRPLWAHLHPWVGPSRPHHHGRQLLGGCSSPASRTIQRFTDANQANARLPVDEVLRRRRGAGRRHRRLA